MWTEYFKNLDRAAQLVLSEFTALSSRSKLQVTYQDQPILALWSDNNSDKQIDTAILEAFVYLDMRHKEMIKRFQNIDMFHLMLSVYAVGDFEIYLRDVHGVGSVSSTEEHPLIRSVQQLSFIKKDIAQAYSPDYDASDAAIAAELSHHNPWQT